MNGPNRPPNDRPPPGDGTPPCEAILLAKCVVMLVAMVITYIFSPATRGVGPASSVFLFLSALVHRRLLLNVACLQWLLPIMLLIPSNATCSVLELSSTFLSIVSVFLG